MATGYIPKEAKYIKEKTEKAACHEADYEVKIRPRSLVRREFFSFVSLSPFSLHNLIIILWVYISFACGQEQKHLSQGRGKMKHQEIEPFSASLLRLCYSKNKNVLLSGLNSVHAFYLTFKKKLRRQLLKFLFYRNTTRLGVSISRFSITCSLLLFPTPRHPRSSPNALFSNSIQPRNIYICHYFRLAQILSSQSGRSIEQSLGRVHKPAAATAATFERLWPVPCLGI